MPLFLESCRQNPAFNWLLLGDQPDLNKTPENVQWRKMTLKEFNIIAKHETGLAFDIRTPYKICDVKPMFGRIFHKYLNGFTFWGCTDIDLVYGDLDSFNIRKDLLSCDIYAPYDSPVGHFTLYRNTKEINELYLSMDNLQKAYQDSEKPLMYDEIHIGNLIKRSKKIRFKSVDYKTELKKNHCAVGATIMPYGQIIRERFSAQERYLWSNGKTYQLNGLKIREFMYLHFFSWKKDLYWQHFNGDRTLPNEFWLDASGYTTNPSELIPTNTAARVVRSIQCLSGLIKRGVKYYLSTRNFKRRIF